MYPYSRSNPPKPPYHISVYCDYLGASVISFETVNDEYLIKEQWSNLGPTSFQRIVDKAIEFSKGLRPCVYQNPNRPLLGLLRRYRDKNYFYGVSFIELDPLEVITIINSLLDEKRIVYETDLPEMTRALENFSIDEIHPIVNSLIYGIGRMERAKMVSGNRARPVGTSVNNLFY